MSAANDERSTQGVRSDGAEGDDGVHRVHAHHEHNALSRMSIVVLALYLVVTAGLLVYARQYAARHPGVVFVEVLGFPVLVLLVFILRKRRRSVG